MLQVKKNDPEADNQYNREPTEIENRILSRIAEIMYRYIDINIYIYIYIHVCLTMIHIQMHTNIQL